MSSCDGEAFFDAHGYRVSFLLIAEDHEWRSDYEQLTEKHLAGIVTLYVHCQKAGRP